MNFRLRDTIHFFVIIVVGISIFQIQRIYTREYIDNANNQMDYILEEEKIKANLELQKKLPALGFNNIWADWLYLQFIQYVGDSPARKKAGYSQIINYFELVSQLDPYFLDAHLKLSTTNSVFTGRVDKSLGLMENILEKTSPSINPDAYLLWLYKGMDEMLFLGDIPAAIKSYEKSAQWALARGDEEGKIMAQRNLKTAEFLRNNPDSKNAQVMAWGTVFSSAFDDETRKIARERIEELGGDIIIQDDGKVFFQLPPDD